MTGPSEGSLGDLFVHLHANLDGYRRDMRQFEQITSQSADNSMSNLLRNSRAIIAQIAAVAAAGASVVKGIQSGIEYNAMIEQQRVAFETLLGSAEAAVARVRELEVFAAKTPFEFRGLVNASKILQAFAGSALASGRGLELVGDAAAAVGAPLEEVAMGMGRLTNALLSGTAMGEALQNLTSKGLISRETRAELLMVEGSVLSTAEAMAVMERAFGRYSGAMIKQSTTFNGIVSTLKDNLSMLAGELTQSIFGDLKTGINEANSNLEQFGLRIKVIKDGIVEAAGWIRWLVSGVADLISGSPGIAIQAGIGAAIIAGLQGALPAFGAAIAALPAWAIAGGVMAAAFVAGIATVNATSNAVASLEQESTAARGEDRMVELVRSRIRAASNPEELQAAAALAERLAEGYAASARSSTGDAMRDQGVGGIGAWIWRGSGLASAFGADSATAGKVEQERLTSMADTLNTMARLARERTSEQLQQNEVMAEQRRLADEAARNEEARFEAARKEAETNKKLVEDLKASQRAVEARYLAAQFDVGSAQQKLDILRQEEEVARRLHAEQMQAAQALGDTVAAGVANTILDTSLIEIQKRKDDLQAKLEQWNPFEDDKRPAWSRTGLGTGAESSALTLQKKAVTVLEEIRDAVRTGPVMSTARYAL